MTYLYWYLGIGVAAIAIVFVANRLTTKDESQSLREVLNAVNPDRNRLSYRILNNIVELVLGVILLVVIWPFVIVLMARQLLRPEGNSAIVEEREFAVERSHLLERLSIAEAEHRERVDDPLKAVPDLPFGHLNAAWCKFLEGRNSEDEVWSFSALWQPPWGREELRIGYVLVHGDVPGPHFLTTRKTVDDLVEADPIAGIGGTRKCWRQNRAIFSWLRKPTS